VLALGDVGCGELPVLLRRIQAFEKAPFLLGLRDVQEKLADGDAVAGEVALERADVFVASGPDLLVHQGGWQVLLFEELRMHTHRQHFFVVRAIENPDATPLGQMSLTAPQVVVIQLLNRRRLERSDLAACGLMPDITCLMALSLPAASMA